MTAGNIIDDRVRYILQDTDASAEIWDDTILLTLLKDACTFFEKRLPEALLTAPNTMADFQWTDIVDLTSNLPYGEEWAEALAYYVCWRALGQDGQDKRDVRRAAQMAHSFMGLTGVPLTTD